MAQMGILTEESLGQMAAGVEVFFGRIIDKTGNLEGAIRATWPELVKLYQWYEKMGVDVPGWLQEAIDKGQEMGHSLEVPLSTADAMNEMVRLLGLIAEALGAVEQNARKAGNAIGNMPSPGGGPSGPPQGPGGKGDFGAQSGFLGTITRPTLITAGEIGDETISITPSGGGGGGSTTIVLELDGQVLGRIVTDMSKDGRIRINETAVKEF
jgi:hypothetical protein